MPASKRGQGHGAAPSGGSRFLGWALRHLLIATSGHVVSSFWASVFSSVDLSWLGLLGRLNKKANEQS